MRLPPRSPLNIHTHHTPLRYARQPHNVHSTLVLTLDIGSSSLRANLFDSMGSQLPGFETQLAYDARITPDGGVEIDPNMLLDLLFAAVDGTLRLAGDRVKEIRAVGSCSLVSNLLGVDNGGNPTTPIYTWADTRCAPEARQLHAALDEQAVLDRTGCPIHTSYLPPRLLWLKRTAPDAYVSTSLWLFFADWVYLKLFGRPAQTLSVASWGGLLNRHTLDWDSEWLSILDIKEETLPSLVDLDGGMTSLRDDYASRWPALKGVPWYPCIVDGAAGNVGSGCLAPDQLAMQVGTSAAMRALFPGTVPTIPPGLWCYRLDRHASLLGGALSEGGNVLDWLCRTLNIKDLTALEQQAAAMPPDSHGLTILPFLAGERSPDWHGDAHATLNGLSLSTRPADLLRAAQEAIAYRFALIFSLLRQVLPPTRLIVASGGALLNTPGWLDIVADVLAQPITPYGDQEASSRGVALLALRSLGLLPDLSQVPTPASPARTPNMERHAVYQKGMQRQQELYGLIM